MIVWVLKGIEKLLGLAVGKLPEDKKKKAWKGFLQIVDAFAEGSTRGLSEGAAANFKKKYEF